MMKVQIVILRERCGDGSSKSPERLSNSSLLFEDSRAGDYGVELSSTLCFTSKTRAKKSFIGVRLGYFRTSFFPLRERNNKDDFTRNGEFATVQSLPQEIPLGLTNYRLNNFENWLFQILFVKPTLE